MMGIVGKDSQLKPAAEASRNSPSLSDVSKEKISPLPEASKAEASVPLPAEKAKESNAEFIKKIHEIPLIKTCTMFEGRGLLLFKALLARPRGFRVFVIDQRLEIGLLSIRFPINQSLFARLDEVPSLFHDMRFALDIYRAQKELEENLPLAREIQLHGYYARTIAKILRRNPSLLGNPEVSSLCQQFADIKRPLSQEEMNSEIEGFMRRAQVKPEEIDFDPNFKPDVLLGTAPDGNKVYYPSNGK
ncbi:MAG: hypothetical protein ACXVB1_16125 [Pseudobdellovibrionaceae bacterium]